MLKEQAIFCPVGNHVQPPAHPPEEIATFIHDVEFFAGQEIARKQFVDVGGLKVSFGNPRDCLYVAQATGAGFDIGFEAVLGIGKFAVALKLFLPLGPVEVWAGPDSLGAGGLRQGAESGLLTEQQPCLHQAGGDGDVVGGGFDALRNCSHAMPDIQFNVPEQGDKLLESGLVVGEAVLFDQDEQIHIRVWMQFAAPIAAHGDQADRLLQQRQLAPLPGSGQ